MGALQSWEARPRWPAGFGLSAEGGRRFPCTMNLALDPLERQRDLGLFALRVVIGGTYVFYGFVKLSAGPATWTQLGAAIHLAGLNSGELYWGLAASFAELLGGALLVLGFWVRPAAISLLLTMTMAAAIRWQAIKWGSMETVSGFFYPLSMAAVMFGLTFLGGGKYGLQTGGSGGGGRGRSSAGKES